MHKIWVHVGLSLFVPQIDNSRLMVPTFAFECGMIPATVAKEPSAPNMYGTLTEHSHVASPLVSKTRVCLFCQDSRQCTVFSQRVDSWTGLKN